MTYVVTGVCIRCKYTDCGACEPEYPANAMMSDSGSEAGQWLKLNEKYATVRPNLAAPKDPPPDADAWLDKLDKFSELKPGPGSV